MAKETKYKMDRQAEWQSGHFYLSSVAHWRTGRDIEALVKEMRLDPFPFTVWFVPCEEQEQYSIKMFAPQVEGAVMVASYGMEPLTSFKRKSTTNERRVSQ